jgi:hypothetical protein
MERFGPYPLHGLYTDSAAAFASAERTWKAWHSERPGETMCSRFHEPPRVPAVAVAVAVVVADKMDQTWP